MSVAYKPRPCWPSGVPVGPLPSQMIRGFQAYNTLGLDTGRPQHPQGVSAGWFWAQFLLITALKDWMLQHVSRTTQNLCKSLRTKGVSFTFLKSASYFIAVTFSNVAPMVFSHLLYFSEGGQGSLGVSSPHTRWQGQGGQILVVFPFRLSGSLWTWMPLLLHQEFSSPHLLFFSCFSVSDLPEITTHSSWRAQRFLLKESFWKIQRDKSRMQMIPISCWCLEGDERVFSYENCKILPSNRSFGGILCLPAHSNNVVPEF